MAFTVKHGLAITFLAVAGGIVYVAYRGGPQEAAMTKYVELREGPLQERVATLDELKDSRTFTGHAYPMHYPNGVAAGINNAIAKGHTIVSTIADCQAAAAPAEVMW